MACHSMAIIFSSDIPMWLALFGRPNSAAFQTDALPSGEVGWFSAIREIAGVSPCRCHKERQTLPISVTSRARTPKEPATNRQKGARFIARQCVIRRARCRESGPPCSRGALRSNAPDPPVRNASILPHGSCPGTETGRPGNTFGGLAIRPSRGKMTWFKAGAKRTGVRFKSRPWGSDQSPPS